MDNKWSVYIVQCADNTFYTGISTNVSSRIQKHNTSQKGAKYTQGRRPVELVYHQVIGSKSDALKEEIRIKKLSKTLKFQLISSSNNAIL